MLTVDKINRLVKDNEDLIATLTKVYDILVDGYNEDTPYTAIDNAIKTIDKSGERYCNG